MPRLFVAIRPPEPVRAALLDAMGGVERARWQGDEQLHLTLAFVGESGGAQAEDLIEALAEVESAVFHAEVAGVGHFERKGAPTALWAGVPLTAPLAQLHRRVERACRRAGLGPEKRAYHPHITLARLPRSAGAIGGWLSTNGTLRAEPWDVTGFTLYESHLLRDGSLYRPLVEYEF
ncbi:MAG TPA: RNA 2',3'-cyclic phosphodiesterase [Croceibacterium sp.]